MRNSAASVLTMKKVCGEQIRMPCLTVMRADGTEIPVQVAGGDGYIFSMPAGTVTFCE